MRNNLTLERKGNLQLLRVIAALWMVCITTACFVCLLPSMQRFDYHLWAACPLELSAVLFILNVPPVVFVMARNCLSQHFEKGGLRSCGGFMPGNGTSDPPDKAPTCLSRFKASSPHGISWEGFIVSFPISAALASD